MEKNFLTSLKIVKTTKSPIKVNVQKFQLKKAIKWLQQLQIVETIAFLYLFALFQKVENKSRNTVSSLPRKNQFLRRQLLLYKKSFQNSNLLKTIWPTRQLRKRIQRCIQEKLVQNKKEKLVKNVSLQRLILMEVRKKNFGKWQRIRQTASSWLELNQEPPFQKTK